MTSKWVTSTFLSLIVLVSPFGDSLAEHGETEPRLSEELFAATHSISDDILNRFPPEEYAVAILGVTSGPLGAFLRVKSAGTQYVFETPLEYMHGAFMKALNAGRMNEFVGKLLPNSEDLQGRELVILKTMRNGKTFVDLMSYMLAWNREEMSSSPMNFYLIGSAPITSKFRGAWLESHQQSWAMSWGIDMYYRWIEAPDFTQRVANQPLEAEGLLRGNGFESWHQWSPVQGRDIESIKDFAFSQNPEAKEVDQDVRDALAKTNNVNNDYYFSEAVFEASGDVQRMGGSCAMALTSGPKKPSR